MLAQNTKNIILSSYIADLNIIDDFKNDRLDVDDDIVDFSVYDHQKASLLKIYLKILLS